MKIHEYQAKDIFGRYGIPVVKGSIARKAGEVYDLATKAGGPVIVKAQVHTGGRGKAGGVKYVKTPEEAREIADSILGMNIKGFPVKMALVYKAVDIKSEAYIGFTIDRSSKKIVLIATGEGGVEIEQLAKEKPEAIHKEFIDPSKDINPEIFQNAARKVYNDDDKINQAADIFEKLFRVFTEMDCTVAEINPLVVDENEDLIAVDAKINFDDNALFRHPEYEELRDPSQENSREAEAREYGLSFVEMEGNIGCIVNGAGLAMATMDLIKATGGEPANFLDVGGSSSPDKVLNAIKIILYNPDVKAIVINIFGGITRCDDIAKGIIRTTEMMEIPIPIFVRLTGTNEKEAREMLSGTNLASAETMNEVIEKAVTEVN